MQELRDSIKQAVKVLYGEDIEPEISRPEEQFGDYSTNAALQLAGKVSKSPGEIAEDLAAELKKNNVAASIAGPGFINIRLSDEAMSSLTNAATDLPNPLAGQEILVEFGDPNPFKEMHIGHLYSYIVGDSISRLFEAAGAQVKRLSYHGDVGLHVAKAIYGLRTVEEEKQKLGDAETIDRENFLGKAYAYGAKAYEEDETAKAEIETINQHIYKQDDPGIN